MAEQEQVGEVVGATFKWSSPRHTRQHGWFSVKVVGTHPIGSSPKRVHAGPASMSDAAMGEWLNRLAKLPCVVQAVVSSCDSSCMYS